MAAFGLCLQHLLRPAWVGRRLSASRGDLLRSGPAAFGHLRSSEGDKISGKQMFQNAEYDRGRTYGGETWEKGLP